MAQDTHDGAYVNLGIGMPTMVANHLPPGREVIRAKQTWVMMDLLTRSGESKIVSACTFPLTAVQCVKRIYGDLATLECTPDGLVLIDLVDGLTPDALQELIGQPVRH